MTLLAQNPETDPEIHSPYKYLPQSSGGSPFLQHFPRIPHSSAVRVKVKRVTDEQWGRDSLMSTGEVTLGARVSLGQGACSSPWGTPWRGTGAAATPALARFSLHAAAHLGIPSAGPGEDGCRTCGPRCGGAASSSGASTGAGTVLWRLSTLTCVLL